MKKQMSFIEEARRKQIVAGAVVTIAHRGMSNTSLQDIANEIDVSKGVISYHFASKSELISEVVNYLMAEQRSNRVSRTEMKNSPQEKLREYILADIEFYQHHRDNMICWFELMSFYKIPEEKEILEKRIYDQPRQLLSQIIQEGQAKGVFQSSPDPIIAATIIEGAIEGVMIQWIFNQSQVDLQKCGEELIIVFEKRFLTE